MSRRSSFVFGLFLFPIFFLACRGPAEESDYTPKSGQPGKDIVWVPNPTAMVEKLLDMARITPDDYVVDLGSGDGRNVIAAARRGARAHGIEYNPELVEYSKRLAARENVSDRATFEQGDVFQTDFSKATVIVLFLSPEMNIKLRPRLLDLKPGTRIVANTFAIGDWNADDTETVAGSCEHFCTARLWYVPAKVAGRWKLPRGELIFKQTYQTFSGTLRSDRAVFPITGRLRADQIAFGAGGTQYTGRVNGNVIEGFARTGGVDSQFRAMRPTR
jgi:SAM-dependent methyltransferase